MVALATQPLLWCHCLTTLSLGFKTSIFCHFDLGIDWPVRPLMQVDKGVASQFLLALHIICMKPLSTCLMASQQVAEAGVGFNLL